MPERIIIAICLGILLVAGLGFCLAAYRRSLRQKHHRKGRWIDISTSD